MIYLLVVSLIWAFSFGLIKGNLTGVDSNFVAFARMAVSFLVFLPFLQFRGINPKLAGKLTVTGIIQFGLMYLAYLAAFRTLMAYEVALFTIFTPIFVTLINDAFNCRFNWLHLITALVAVAGTWIIKGNALISPGVIKGFLLVQVSNICYAFGQIYYRRLMAEIPGLRDSNVFGYLYLGGLIVTALATAFYAPLSSFQLTSEQGWAILYLGTVASGMGFFLWNTGARTVNAGTLAIFNNFKIPLAIAVSLLVFKESTNIPALLTGGVIILLALIANETYSRKKHNKGIIKTDPPD